AERDRRSDRELVRRPEHAGRAAAAGTHVPPVVAGGRELIETAARLSTGAFRDVLERLHAAREGGVTCYLEGIRDLRARRRDRVESGERDGLIGVADRRVVGGRQRARRHDGRGGIACHRRRCRSARLRRTRRRLARGGRNSRQQYTPRKGSCHRFLAIEDTTKKYT